MADACRRAAVDQIAWLQRGERRKMRDQARDRKDHQLGIAILAQLAIEIRAHRQILWILDVCDDPWPQWFIGWLALGAQPLLVCILIGAVRHIVAAGVAQHIIQRFLFADTAAAAADHRHQLAFIIHRVIQTADHDRRIWPGDRRRRTEKSDRIVWIGARWVDVLELVNMRRVIQPDRIHMRWLHRRQQRTVVQWKTRVRQHDLPPKNIPVDQRRTVFFRVNRCIVDLLIVFDACNIHYYLPFQFLHFFFSRIDERFCHNASEDDRCADEAHQRKRFAEKEEGEERRQYRCGALQKSDGA